MSQTQITQYMNMTLPQVGVADNSVDTINNDFTIIDGHDHVNAGKSLSDKSIAWASWSLNSWSIYNCESMGFQPPIPSVTFTPPTAPLSLYFNTDNFGTDLFYLDGLSRTVRLTKNGHMNFIATVVGGFKGDFESYNASVTYASSDNTYTFVSNGLLGNIHANTLTVASVMTGTSFIASITDAVNIGSSGFFFLTGSLFCTEGTPNALVKYENQNCTQDVDVSTNSRLILNPNRVQNIPPAGFLQNFRKVRWGLPTANNRPVVNVVGQKPPLGTCVITLIQGSFFPHGGTTYNTTLDFQNPAQDINTQWTTSINYIAGAITGVTPVFTETTGTIEAYVTFNAGGSYYSPTVNTANKLLHLTIVVQSTTISPKVTSFSETYGVDSTASVISAFYTFNVIDLNTGLGITNYYCVLRA